MNAINKLSKKPTEAENASAATVEDSQSQTMTDYHMLALQARDHVRDLDRVQSIVWGLSDPLRAKIHKAQERTDEIETAVPEAFLENVVWLVELLVDRAEPLEKSLKKVGLQP